MGTVAQMLIDAMIRPDWHLGDEASAARFVHAHGFTPDQVRCVFWVDETARTLTVDEYVHDARGRRVVDLAGGAGGRFATRRRTVPLVAPLTDFEAA